MKQAVLRWAGLTFVMVLNLAVVDAERALDYVVVVSRETNADAKWSKVVRALVKKHDASVLEYETAAGEALERLRKMHPRYTCFVARPSEATKLFVSQVHKLTRKYDDDPYTDTLWGILTGFDAANALEIARHDKPLVVRKVASGTAVALEMCEEGVWYCELNKGKMVRKQRGGAAKELKVPDDTTQALVDALNDYKADLFVTSGHATAHDWQIGFRYRNGKFVSEAGQMFGVDTGGRRIEIDSPNPKVYLPIGNCLMGNIDGADAMALAWMKDAGVRQMIGYTVPTWYGYAGWGCLDYFLEQPGRYTFAEAFFANHHALMHRLVTCFPAVAGADVAPGARARVTAKPTDRAKALGLNSNDARGLLFDRDVVAFYGDPKWRARMADGEKAWEQRLEEKDGVYTFTIEPKRGERSFEPINTNGSQRGWRPIVEFFEARLENVELLEGADLNPVVADDFLLIPNPRKCDPNRSYRVKFRATKIR